MALPFSFFAIAMAFIAISMSYFNKAKKMPDTNETETAERKKVQNTAITFLTIGISFISVSVAFAVS